MVNILNRLPQLKLCYEKILHNKVSADEYMAIPKGKRALLWFTYENNKNVCFILYLNRDNKIIKYEKEITGFSSDLVIGQGTILYGIIFNQNSINRCSLKNFAIINLFYLEGNYVFNVKYREKAELFKHLFTKISQQSLNKRYLIIGLPIISNNYNSLINSISRLNYKIHSIKPINLNLYNLNLNFLINNNNSNSKNNNNSNSKNNNNSNSKNNNNSSSNKCIFNVAASIEQDIYLLSDKENKIERIAFIPNYNTSVMMNRLFRNIKENENLDLLEESDSDNEFENIEADKYVYLNKIIKMICVFNYKFKKWVPVRVADINIDLSTKNDILSIEKKYM